MNPYNPLFSLIDPSLFAGDENFGNVKFLSVREIVLPLPKPIAEEEMQKLEESYRRELEALIRL